MFLKFLMTLAVLLTSIHSLKSQSDSCKVDVRLVDWLINRNVQANQLEVDNKLFSTYSDNLQLIINQKDTIINSQQLVIDKFEMVNYLSQESINKLNHSLRKAHRQNKVLKFGFLSVSTLATISTFYFAFITK